MKRYRVTSESGTQYIEATSFKQIGDFVSFYAAAECVALIRLDYGDSIVEERKPVSAQTTEAQAG
jgi:hypothetical protein